MWRHANGDYAEWQMDGKYPVALGMYAHNPGGDYWTLVA